MSNIVEIAKNFNVKLALKNIYTKIDEIITRINNSDSRVVNGSLSAEQINNLDAFVETIVDAVPGKVIFIENAVVKYAVGTSLYVTSGIIYIGYKQSPSENLEPYIQCLDENQLSGNDSVVAVSQYGDYDFNALPRLESKPIGISCSAPISGGNGTITYSIKYRIATV